jgi:membrane protease YdiL (CAAX protease family)
MVAAMAQLLRSRDSVFGMKSLALFYVLACAFGWVFYLVEALGGAAGENLPLGPVLAMIVVATVRGRRGWREWMGELTAAWPTGRWIAVAVAAPTTIMGLSVLGNYLLGAPLPTADQLSVWYELPVTFLLMMIAVGIGEESGWMGFAAPVLSRRNGLLTTWATLSVLRIFWHLPLMLDGDLPWVLGVVGNAAFQFLLLVAFRRTRGGWVIAAVWHSALNALGGAFFFQMVDGADQARLGVIMSLLYVAVALTAYVVDRRSTARRLREARARGSRGETVERVA